MKVLRMIETPYRSLPKKRPSARIQSTWYTRPANPERKNSPMTSRVICRDAGAAVPRAARGCAGRASTVPDTIAIEVPEVRRLVARDPVYHEPGAQPPIRYISMRSPRGAAVGFARCPDIAIRGRSERRDVWALQLG